MVLFKLLLGGRIDTICFDKTGTITENGMDLDGILISKEA
jgi:P-type E1-E2 ATPase